jgi:hypothetical protein
MSNEGLGDQTDPTDLTDPTKNGAGSSGFCRTRDPAFLLQKTPFFKHFGGVTIRGRERL